MFKVILLLTSAVFLTSSGYALQPRDRAARSFQHRLDAVQNNNDNSYNSRKQGSGDNNNGGNNRGDQQRDDQQGGDQQGYDENNNSSDQNNDGNQNNDQPDNNNQSNDITLEQKLNDLMEDMKSVMLHLDRLDRRIAAIENTATHKEKKDTAKKHKNVERKQKKSSSKKHKK